MDQERKLPSFTKEGDRAKYRPLMRFILLQHLKALKRSSVCHRLYEQRNSLCPKRFTHRDVKLTQPTLVSLSYKPSQQFLNADI